MAVVETTTQTTVDTSKDNVAIQAYLEGVPGGRTLDVSGAGLAALTTLSAGHVIIKETATGEYKALGISGSAYVALPAEHEYAGILVASILTAKPHAAILVRGTVNESEDIIPYPIPAAAKTALSLIRFITN